MKGRYSFRLAVSQLLSHAAFRVVGVSAIAAMIVATSSAQSLGGAGKPTVYPPTDRAGHTTVLDALLPKRKNEVYQGLVLVKLKGSQVDQLVSGRRLAASSLPPALRTATFRNRVYTTNWTVWQIPREADVRTFAAELRGSGQVVNAQPLNRIYPLVSVPNDGDWNTVETGAPMIPLGEDQSFRRLWYLDDVSAKEAWDIYPNQWYTSANKPANGPLIAVIDTGIDIGHPDYMNAGGSSTNSTQGGQLVHSLGRQFTFGEPVTGGTWADELGHGTHVAGLALAAGNNGHWDGADGNSTTGTGPGMVGIGYNSRGMILRVFDGSGNGSDADAAAAMFFAADNGADIINLSLGTENFSSLFQEAVTYAVQKGVLVIAASNEDGAGGGDLGPIYPAASAGVLAVTANGPGYYHASDYYAGTGRYIDVAAPGGNAIIDYNPDNPSALLVYIYSTTMRQDNPIMRALNGEPPPGYDLGYGYLIGTSMASPIVAGGAGLYYGLNDLRANQGFANHKAFRAITRAAVGAAGAPKGSWELYQGYGCFDAYLTLLDSDTRTATAGAAEGMVYFQGQALGNVAVRARKIGSTTTFQTTTQTDGSYRFDQLPPGEFRVWVAPNGELKEKYIRVVEGTEAIATNFYVGYYEDDTAPTIARFTVPNVPDLFTNPARQIEAWAYDTETGIDLLTISAGTTAGGTDILPETRVVQLDRFFSVAGPDLAGRKRVFITLRAKNGKGAVTSQTVDFAPVAPPFDASPVAGSMPSSVARNAKFTVTLRFTNTGTTPWITSRQRRISLMSCGPDNNTVWGTANVVIPPGVSVAPGQTLVLPVELTAPATTGPRMCQWQLAVNGTRFGARSEEAWINVTN